MRTSEFRFQFTADVDLAEAEKFTLRRSLRVAEGLHGEAKVRTEVTYAVDPIRAEIRVSGGTAPAEATAQIYTSLLSHEFGREAFTVRRETAPAVAAAAA